METSRQWHNWILPDWDCRRYREQRGSRPPTWDKCRRLVETMQGARNGDLILYLDCDALIRLNITAALAAAMAEYDFGAVENTSGIFNCGVMAWQVNPQTRACAEQIEEQGPDIRQPIQEQDTIDFYVRRQLKCATLPRNWNDYPYARGTVDREQPVYVTAWHGSGPDEARRRMEVELAKLSHAA